jgi:hypothetical protein
MWEDFSWLKGLGPVGAICATVLVLVVAEFWSRMWMDEDRGVISGVIHSLRGPRQIITHNVCPKCQKTQTKTTEPEG